LQETQAGITFDIDLFQSFAGVGHEDLVVKLNKRFGVEMPVSETAHRKDALYAELVDRVEALEPVATYARELARLGCKISVASGGSHDLVRRSLRAAGLLECFEDRCIVTQDDVQHSKPDPEIFLLAAERMGVPAEECVVLEDSLLGMEGARACSMAVVEIPRTV
jgi:HAD superfamily hydrolase (TIGR01509 family)